MEIYSLSIDGQRIVFPESESFSRNKVDLLTGPNGSGKTRALSTLAEEFIRRRSFSRRGSETPDNIHIGIDENHLPEKVIAQTYSPFSRFPPSPPKSTRNSLTSIYAEGNRRIAYYSCLGLWRTRRPRVDEVSKQALEVSIFNLTESPECAELIAKVMRNIGFQDKFTLTYKLDIQVDRLLRANRVGGAEAIFEELTNSWREFGSRALRDELNSTSPIQLSELLSTAFNILNDLEKLGGRFYRAVFGSHSRKSTYDFAIIQSLALLRQLDMLSLSSCHLTNFDGTSFDVVQASSGQQQMICSIMELATSLEDNTLVLIDEPELSLHPQWQQMYLDHLYGALEPFEGCHVLVATHSPLVVQRGLQTGAGVIQLGVDHDPVHPDFSASVEGALLDVFETPVSNSVYLANQIFAAITKAENGGARARNTSRQELIRLESIYSKSSTDNGKTLELIRKAMLLLEPEGRNGA